MQIEQGTLWEQFYSGDTQVFYPSEFAKSVLPQLTSGWDILDVGCGNGRDSIFFANHGMNVTAVDRSQEAILHIKKQEQKIHAVCGDFAVAPVFTAERYDSIGVGVMLRDDMAYCYMFAGNPNGINPAA